jgi:hypothetical protein
VQNSKVKIMNHYLLAAISAFALAGLLVADFAWPSLAEEIPAAAPAAEATIANSVPGGAAVETSDAVSQDVEAPAQNMQGSADAASQHRDEPAAEASDFEWPAH